MKDAVRKIGILGCGTVTQTSYAFGLPTISAVKVVAVYDLNGESARKVAAMFGASVTNPVEMLQAVDIVIVATPPNTHAALVDEALGGGRTVICEKPFVGHRADAERLIAKAGNVGSALFVAHFRRMFSHVQLVRSISETGIFGRVRRIRMIEGGRFSWDAQSEYTMKDPLGGVLYDTGSHTVDTALYAAALDEEPATVELLSIDREQNEPSHEIRASFRLICQSTEVDCQLHLSRYRVLANIISIECEHGTIEFSPGLSPRIRLVKGGRRSIIFPERPVSDYMSPFTEQYRDILQKKDGDRFRGDRFLTLTSVLETVAAG